MLYLFVAFFGVLSAVTAFTNDHLKCAVNQQDTPLNLIHSPLKDLTSFAVLPLSPPFDSSRKKLSNTLYEILKSKLNSLGMVKEMTLNDPTGFGFSQVFLSFDMQKVEDMNGKECKIFRISLSVPTLVT